MSRDAQHPHGDRPGRPAAMSREAAERILRRHGLDAAGLAPAELRRRWQDLARRQVTHQRSLQAVTTWTFANNPTRSKPARSMGRASATAHTKALCMCAIQ